MLQVLVHITKKHPLKSRNISGFFHSYTNKMLKFDNAVIIYLLLHFKHMLNDIKLYFFTRKHRFDRALLPMFFPFHACRAYSNGLRPW